MTTLPQERTRVPDPDPDHGSSRVHVVSGSFGAGHDAAAAEITARLVEQGHQVTRWDVVDLFPWRLGPLVRAAYLRQLAVSPRSWGVLLALLQPGRLLHRLVGRALHLTSPRLLAIADQGSDLIISTHPFASQALGRLRADGRLATSVVTYLTDASVHPLWVHPGVDLHLALHEVAAEQARGWGGVTSVVVPVTPRRPPPMRSAAGTRWAVRSTLGLHPDESLALVVGGSLGIGQLEESAVDILATGLARPVVMCGHNESLRRRLVQHPGVIALGWRDDLADLLQAADCVVQNAGGFMSLEALAASVPVLSYRPVPGHGMTNAAALAEAGLAPWAQSGAELSRELRTALSQPASPPSPRPGARELLDVLGLGCLEASA